MLNFVLWMLVGAGTVVLSAGLVAVLCIGYATFEDLRAKSTSGSYGEGYADALKRLRGDAWWFSESPETCELLQDLANRMHVEAAREKWRKAKREVESQSAKVR